MSVPLEQFIKQIEESGVLSQDLLRDFIASRGTPKDSDELARKLVAQKVLTKFQADQIALSLGKSLMLGNYILLEKIGQGGMGSVFKAQHRRMKRIVAIKMLPSNLVENADAAARFQREVEAAAKLRHQNIVAADDADEANGVHFLVMEYVEGSDLSALVKRDGPLSVGEAVDYILQAARGLEFAHSEGVVHRDIKPGNLLVDKKGTIKILDMGLARIEGNTANQAELTGPGAVMGTVDYMAPEQALNTKHADARSDVYSLGISLWSLLIGRAAYDGDTLMAKLLAHRYAPIPSLCSARDDVPTRLDDIFRKMVAKQPQDRYQSMTGVISDLNQCVNDQSLPARVNAARDDGTVQFNSPVKSYEGHLGSANTVHRTRFSTSVETLAKADAQSRTDELTRISDSQTQTWISMPPEVRKALNENSPDEVNSDVWWCIRRRYIIGGLAGILSILAVLLLAVPKSASPTVSLLRVEVLDPNTAVKVQGNAATFQAGSDAPATLDAGEKTLVVTRGGLSFETKPFDLKPGQETRVKVELLDNRLLVTTSGRLLGDMIVSTGPSTAVMQAGQIGKGPPETGSSEVSQAAKPQSLWDRYRQHAVQITNDLKRKLDLIASAEFQQWRRDVAAMTGEMQVAAVGRKLAELNPGFDGKLTPMIQDGIVTGLRFLPELTDVSPLWALPGLTQIDCRSNEPETAKLSDLAPLKAFSIVHLDIGGSPVADLSPLDGMPLETLWVDNTLVTDLTPLTGMRLTEFGFTPHKITQGMEIVRQMSSIKIIGVAVNEKWPADEFWKKYDSSDFGRTTMVPSKPITDFNSPDFLRWVKDVTVLPTEKQVEAVSQKLMELNPGFDGKVHHSIFGGTVFYFAFSTEHVSDISPVRALEGLKYLRCDGIERAGLLANLSPLKGMKLTMLTFCQTQVSDLSVLGEINTLTDLQFSQTKVTDLLPLRGLALTDVVCNGNQISDLSPLKLMPLGVLICDFKADRDANLLRSITKLRKINGKPVAEFWKDVESQQ